MALTGAFIDKRQNPNQPFTGEEVYREVTACVEAGATWIHFHVRDAEGGNIGEIEEYRKIVQPIRDRYGDKVLLDGCAAFGKNSKDVCAPVTKGLFETGVVNPVCTFAGSY